MVDFFLNPRSSGQSSVYRGRDNRFESRVPMRPFSTILNGLDLDRIAFVKVDVEGSEPHVLDALAAVAERLADDVEIVVEFDPERGGADGKAPLWPSIERLRRKGFSAHVIQEAYDPGEYVGGCRNGDLRRLEEMPHFFCDILLRRMEGRQ